MELTREKVLSLLPERKEDGHKGNYGRLLLLCGSRGYTGAAALAAMGALRCGGGLVYVGVPESIYTIEAIKLTEAMVFPLPEEAGMLSEDGTTQIRQLLKKMDAVLIGCGLGQSTGTKAVLSTVLREFDGPVIVDADGLSLLATSPELMENRKAPTILTPHDGEFSRLYPDTDEDRLTQSIAAAKKWNCILVRKGHHTLITDGTTVYVNPTGNPGMATGGSGDVLAGMILGLLGQGIAPLEAAACGVWIHGAAGDRCAQRLGQYAMLPSDLLTEVHHFLK